MMDSRIGITRYTYREEVIEVYREYLNHRGEKVVEVETRTRTDTTNNGPLPTPLIEIDQRTGFDDPASREIQDLMGADVLEPAPSADGSMDLMRFPEDGDMDQMDLIILDEAPADDDNPEDAPPTPLQNPDWMDYNFFVVDEYAADVDDQEEDDEEDAASIITVVEAGSMDQYLEASIVDPDQEGPPELELDFQGSDLELDDSDTLVVGSNQEATPPPEEVKGGGEARG